MRTAQHASVGWGDLRRAPDDPRPPGALVMGAGFIAALAWVALAASVGLDRSSEVVGVALIAVVAAWWLTVPTAVGLGAICFLVLDGFVEHSLGQLGWDGHADLLLVLALLVLPAMSAELAFEVRSEVADRRAGATEPDEGG